jgi:hypothetical protein
MREKNRNPGNVASWIDREAKKKSLAQGREKLYKSRREAGNNSFTDEHRNALRLKKLEQYNNYLAIYLIESGIDTKELMQAVKNLNTPDRYINELRFTKAIERFVTEVDKERHGAIAYATAFKLITKSLKIKKTKFPLQMASINQRESKKNRK